MVYPYMIGKGDWGSYSKAFDYWAAVFASRDPASMAANSGVDYDAVNSAFLVESFGQRLEVTYPEARVRFAGGGVSPTFAWCLPVINYLARADGTPLSGDLISYRELESGTAYYPAFRREAINRLSRWSEGKSAGLLARAAVELGGELSGGADFACTLRVLPRFPIVFKIWFPDDELGGSANLLFDSTANHYLHTEDIAAMGELAAHFIIRHCNFLAGENGD